MPKDTPSETPRATPRTPAGRPARVASPTETAAMSRRRSERFQREQRQRRQIAILAGGIVLLCVLVLVGGFYLANVAPNIRELGHVYDTKITTGDFYKYRKIQVYNELAFYQQFAAQQGGQSSQFQTQIDALQAELKNITSDKIEGERATSLDNYMTDLVVIHQAQADLGITVSKNDLDTIARNDLLPATPTVTLLPATGTAVAQITGTANDKATATEGVRATKTANITATADVVAQATATQQPGYTPAPTTVAPTNTPVVTATATASGTATPTATGLPQSALEGTATANLGQEIKSYQTNTNTNFDDFKQFVTLPGQYKKLADDKLRAKIPAVGASVPSIHLYELKFANEGDAKDFVAQVKAANGDVAKIKDLFAKYADLNNADQPSPSKENAGERGWLPTDGTAFTTKEKEVEAAAKALKTGDVSNQIGTTDGWYVLYTDAVASHPLTDDAHTAVQTNALDRWTQMEKDKAIKDGQYVFNTDIVPATATTGPTATVAPTTAPAPTTVPPTQAPLPGLPTVARSPQPTATGGTAATGTTITGTPGVSATTTGAATTSAPPTSAATTVPASTGAPSTTTTTTP